MTSPLLALFARSLREDVRSKLTYFARAGLVLMILLFLFSTQETMGWGNAPGLRFFSAVVTIDCCFILLAGLSYFASAITEEKEEMTLGLLRMTNLNPLSILLGKSTSRLVGALLLLAAQMPFTLLAISLGGVSMHQVIACYCTLGAFAIFLSNLALLASVLLRRSGAAAGLTGCVLFGGFIVVPLLNFIATLPRRFGAITADAAWVSALNAVAEAISEASPFERIGAILNTGFHEGPWCWQVGSNLALGAGCFIVAWAVFDIFCGEQPESGPRRGAVARRTSVFRRAGAGRAWPRALAWKDFYFLSGGKVAMIVKFAVYLLPIVAMALWPESLGGPPRHDAFGDLIMFWMGLAFVAEISFIAARVFRAERQWKTLSSLATLPMSMRSVAYQKLLGCLPALIPAVAYFILGVFIAADSIAKALLYISGEAVIVFCYFIAQVIFFLHLVAWLSLRMKRGALAVAVGIDAVMQFFLVMFVGALFREVAGMIPVIVLVIFASAVLHASIGARMEQLAAED